MIFDSEFYLHRQSLCKSRHHIVVVELKKKKKKHFISSAAFKTLRDCSSFLHCRCLSYAAQPRDEKHMLQAESSCSNITAESPTFTKMQK